MQVVYAQEYPTEVKSKLLFLAGCSTRNQNEVKSWRPKALQLLQDAGYDGTVCVPEPRDGKFKNSYNDQIAWEETYLELSSVIPFWFPRDLSLDSNSKIKNAGFISNVEFGRYEKSGKIVLGYPRGAPKMGYIHYYAEKYNVPIAHSLEETIDNALQMLNK